MDRHVDGTTVCKHHDPLFRWKIKEVCFRVWTLIELKLRNRNRTGPNCSRAQGAQELCMGSGLSRGPWVALRQNRNEHVYKNTCECVVRYVQEMPSSHLRYWEVILTQVCHDFPCDFLADRGVFSLDRGAATPESSPICCVLIIIPFDALYDLLSCWRRH